MFFFRGPKRHSIVDCRQESIRTAFLLSQGGEFAFVLLSLANELKVLPTDLNRLLIIVVVLSMALTPFLAEAGKRFAESAAPDETSEGMFRPPPSHTCLDKTVGHCQLARPSATSCRE
jgi:predicted Kef-type K+ transport protein